jgi:SAM-dependent methyltransferase
MSTSHWDKLYGAWSRLQTPVRVQDEVVSAIRRQIADRPGRVLLLGVTGGLTDIRPDVFALDRDEASIRDRWPGDGPARCAVMGDWRQPPFASGAFAACIGDGIPIALRHPDTTASFYTALADVLAPGGRFVCRVFAMPDIPETVDAVRGDALQGKIRRYMAFKFRLAMAVCAERGSPNIPVQHIHDAFEANFRDRDALAAAGGWDRAMVDTIDVYRSSPQVYSFPTRQQCLSVVPAAFANARFVPVGGYELAERYPLLVMERAAAA